MDKITALASNTTLGLRLGFLYLLSNILSIRNENQIFSFVRKYLKEDLHHPPTANDPKSNNRPLEHIYRTGWFFFRKIVFGFFQVWISGYP